MFTAEQKKRLRKLKLSRTHYHLYINKYIDKSDELPSNIVLLFNHILDNKRPDQIAYMHELDIYWIDYKAKQWRKDLDCNRWINITPKRRKRSKN